MEGEAWKFGGDAKSLTSEQAIQFCYRKTRLLVGLEHNDNPIECFIVETARNGSFVKLNQGLSFETFLGGGGTWFTREQVMLLTAFPATPLVSTTKTKA